MMILTILGDIILGCMFAGFYALGVSAGRAATRQELEAQRARACKTTAALTGMPGGGGDGQALPRAVESIVAAQQGLQAQINLCGATRREVVAALDQVTDTRDHEILRRRYLLGQRFEEIAVEMCLEYRWVRRIHKKCIGKMDILNKGYNK